MFGLAALLVCTSRPSLAQEPASTQYATARLTWPDRSSEATCFTPADLQNAVESLVERPVFRPSPLPDTFIELHVAKLSPGWQATIKRQSGNGEPLGERTLRVPEESCDTLLGNVALVVAMLVDRQRERATLQLPATDERRPSRPWGGAAMMGMRLSYGMFPSWALAPSAAAEVKPPGFWPLRASLAVWPGAGTQQQGVGGRFHGWYGSFSVAPVLASGGGWLVGPWAGVGVGQLNGQGTAMPITRENSHLWAHTEAGVHSAIHLAGPLWLRLALGAAVPWNRPRFVYTAADGSKQALYRPSALGLVADTGLEARFGP